MSSTDSSTNATSDRRQACAWTQDSIAKGDPCYVDPRFPGAVFTDRGAARAAARAAGLA